MIRGILIGCHHGLNIKDLNYIKVNFEKFIKTKVLPNASLDGTNPGKGEFYDDSKLEEVLNI